MKDSNFSKLKEVINEVVMGVVKRVGKDRVDVCELVDYMNEGDWKRINDEYREWIDKFEWYGMGYSWNWSSFSDRRMRVIRMGSRLGGYKVKQDYKGGRFYVSVV